jgi:hypothetical protein
MMKFHSIQRVLLSSALTGLCLTPGAASFAHAQPTLQFPPSPSDSLPPSKILDRYPQTPSLPPIFTIPVGPLGFSLPGEYYLLRNQSFVSLDFIDEDRLLFTFRVSGLIERDAADKSEDKQQHIQAVVLSLPSGNVDSRAEWIAPDRSRYLWMLNDGRFLLRTPEGLDIAGLDEGDARIETKSYLRLPGQLLWIEMDPGQQVLISNALEPESASQQPAAPGPSVKVGPSTADPPATPTNVQKPIEQGVLVARTHKRATGEILLVSRFPFTSQTTDWPMNSQGYLEKSLDSVNEWLLTLNYFSGGNKVLARISSTCPPKYNFVSDSELLFTRCDPDVGWKLGAMLTRGDLLWEVRTASNAMVPLLVMAPNGSRFARETLLLKHPADRYKRKVGPADFEGQIVKVLDAANGTTLLESPLTPILDGGGNVAISPSGRRVAILNGGAIQVFQLPGAPPQPSGSR